MKTIVAGSHRFDDFPLLRTYLDFFFHDQPPSIILSGGARGADKLGERYAISEGIAINLYPANWDKYGVSAGYKRNEEMAKNGDRLIAFWDCNSIGTKHMIELAETYKLEIDIVYVRIY